MDKVIEPRFEFRVFGRNFSAVGKQLAVLTGSVPEAVRSRTSSEIYIVTQDNDVNNVKIRDGKMDIKTLLASVDGLEQWSPLLKAEFPISAHLLEERIFPALQLRTPVFARSDCPFDAFLDLIEGIPELCTVKVFKQRTGYHVNDTICEYAHVLIDGLALDTVAIESTEIKDIKKNLVDLRLAGVENINYLQAIKRVIGLIDKPLAN